MEKHPMLNKISKDSYPNMIIEQVLKSIKDGALKPGDQLPPEPELSRQFNVGRTSVREALAGLEYLDIIRIDNGKCFVNQNTSSFFSKKLAYHVKINKKQRSDLIDACRILQTEFARLAASRATVNDVKRLRQILKALEALQKKISAVQQPDDDTLQEFCDNCLEFYCMLAKSTQNTMYERLFARFKDMIFPLLYDWLDATYALQTCEAFARTLKAIENRDCSRAYSAMLDYMTQTQSQLLSDNQREEENHV